MKIAALIILYYPKIENIDLIYKVIDIFDKVYVYDNTDGKSILNIKKYIDKYSNVEYIHSGVNHGLSYPYNYISKLAVNNSYDYLALFDQDSSFQKDDLKKLTEDLVIINEQDVAIYAPRSVNSNAKNKFIKSHDYSIVNTVISSGSFINLNIYMKSNGFDENYFIDRIDQDYCRWAVKSGYKIIVNNDIVMEQNLGTHTNNKIFNKGEHSPIRHYYISRNRLYYLKKYHGVISFVVLSLIGVFSHLVKVLIFEKDKTKKIKYMIFGCVDFHNKKMKKANR